MNPEKLQEAIDRCEKLNTLTIRVLLVELQRIDEVRGLRDQAEIDYWTERLNKLCDTIELEDKYAG